MFVSHTTSKQHLVKHINFQRFETSGVRCRPLLDGLGATQRKAIRALCNCAVHRGTLQKTTSKRHAGSTTPDLLRRTWARNCCSCWKTNRPAKRPQRTKGPTEKKTKRIQDQKTKRPEDHKNKRANEHTTKGQRPKGQKTTNIEEPMDQKTDTLSWEKKQG